MEGKTEESGGVGVVLFWAEHIHTVKHTHSHRAMFVFPEILVPVSNESVQPFP